MNPSDNRISHSLICIILFISWYFSSFLILFMPNVYQFLRSSYAMPMISIGITLPFILICWLYYQKKFNLMSIGRLDLPALVLPSIAIIILMFFNDYFGVQEEWVSKLGNLSGGTLFLYVIAIVIVAPISEEIAFRGFLLNAGMWYGPWGKHIAIIVSSIVFSSVHSQYTAWSTFISIFIMGVILCHVRLSTRSLIAPMTLHALNNSYFIFYLFFVI